MSQDFEIRPFASADLEAVRQLYATAFHEPHPHVTSADLPAEFDPAMHPPRALVAVSKGRVVGLAAFVPLGAAVRDRRMLTAFLRAARTVNRTDRSPPGVFHVAAFELFWESYDNAFTRSDIEPTDEDLYFTALAVAQPFRRMGIGTALARRRVALAAERGARSVFVGCWEGGRAAHLYERLGFLPVVRWGPAYDDGSDMRLMAYELPR